LLSVSCRKQEAKERCLYGPYGEPIFEIDIE